MEKVLLSKEAAKALETALEGVNGDKESVSQYHATSGLWEGKCQALNVLGLKEVNTALYVGYEIEAGPEEKVIEYYEQHIQFRGAIREVLNLFSIEVKGINC